MKKKVVRNRAPQVVTFKKDAKEGTLPKQAVAILEIVSKAGTLTVDQLKAKMEGKITTTQPVASIWSFYRKQLIDDGYIKVAKAEKAAKAPKKAKAEAVAA